MSSLSDFILLSLFSEKEFLGSFGAPVSYFTLGTSIGFEITDFLFWTIKDGLLESDI
jgi:hypothetical protein